MAAPDGGHFVVTGSGKCGTHYLQAVLTELGVPTAHEGVLEYHPVESPPWGPFRGDSSWPAAMHLHVLCPGTPVLHLVRDPLAVVNARYGENKLCDTHREFVIREFVRRHMPDVFTDAHGDLGRALLFVERWNRHLDRTPVERPQLRYLRRRVEAISSDPEALDAVVEFLAGERVGIAACEAALRRVSPETGRSSSHAALTWPDVEAHPNGAGLAQLAVDYGYRAA
jgi:hypothetical protein